MRMGFNGATHDAIEKLHSVGIHTFPNYNQATGAVTYIDVEFNHTLKVRKVALEGREELSYGDTRDNVRYYYLCENVVFYKDRDNILRLVDPSYQEEKRNPFVGVNFYTDNASKGAMI